MAKRALWVSELVSEPEALLNSVRLEFPAEGEIELPGACLATLSFDYSLLATRQSAIAHRLLGRQPSASAGPAREGCEAGAGAETGRARAAASRQVTGLMPRAGELGSTRCTA